MQTINVPLYDGVATGLARALESWSKLGSPEYRWLLSLSSRARIREYWEAELPATGWSIGGNVRLMGQTFLVCPDRKVLLRLLKENGAVHPGGVPIAGRNQARRRSWAQDPVPGLELEAQEPAAIKAVECLFLWDYDVSDGQPIISARVVHTTGPGHYGIRVPIDMSFQIKPSGTIFDQMRFAGSEEREDLFPNIDQRENESADPGN